MQWQPLAVTRFNSSLQISRPSVPIVARFWSHRGIASRSVADILELPQTGDSYEVTAKGSVRTIRRHKSVAFVELRDGSTIHTLQALLRVEQAQGLGTGASVAVSGKWTRSLPGLKQNYELKAENVDIIGASDAGQYPLQKKYHTPEYLRTLPHLRLRTPFNSLLARLRSECEFHVNTYFHGRNFIRVQPPIITSSDCEGAGEVFEVSSSPAQTSSTHQHLHGESSVIPFFRNPKFLTVSSQLHLEAFVHEHQRVWTLSPTFRAEKSDTPRHVSEFWMLEAEIQTQSLAEVMDLAEDIIRYIVTNLQRVRLYEELVEAQRAEPTAIDQDKPNTSRELIPSRWGALLGPKWPQITYGEAINLLTNAVESNQIMFHHVPFWGISLQLEHEKFIVTVVGQGRPVFVTDYPEHVKPFYMLPSSPDGQEKSKGRATVGCFDLLLPDVCEVVGGSLREHRQHKLVNSMALHHLHLSPGIETPEQTQSMPLADKASSFGNLDWYVDLRRYGSVPHGGFGLGFDRLLSYLTGVANIRDIVPWPRYYGRCDG